MRRRAIDMALEPQQDQRRWAMLAAGPLPEGLDCLIRIVALGEWRCAETEEAYRQHGAEFIRNASAAFLIRVLFTNPHDPYRTLGLNPSASTRQVQENKRLLLKWLHPDVNSNALEQKYINQVVEAAAAVKTGWRRTTARRTANRQQRAAYDRRGERMIRPSSVLPLSREQTFRPWLRRGVRWLGRSLKRLLALSLIAAAFLLCWTYIVGEPIGLSIARYSRSALALVSW